MEYRSNDGIVYFHDTPWNTIALQGKSLEIDLIEPITENTKNIIFDFCTQKSKESYLLISTRISASLNELKKIYFQCGFITVEHTLDVVSCNLDLEKISNISNKFPVIVEDYSIDNITEIEDISELEFNYGRFYEDPYIHPTISKTRNKNWIADLINQQSTIKVLKKKNVVVGFMAYKVQDDKVKLILGGVKENYRYLAYGFWANILLSLKDVKEIKTLISSSNTDVLNLYSFFGFRFENPQFGLQKHL